MALINSRSLRGEREAPVAEKKLADKDITVKDAVGRTVVVVAKGQPIPDDLDARKKLFGEVSRNATDDEIAAARGETTTTSSRKRGK